jgi:uncharacterized protein (UPF0147 family)
MADETQNKESMKEAIETLEQITASNSTPKTIKKSITQNIHYQ